jgi:hypothetical protein
MEYFWKENKKFLRALAGGTIFFCLCYSFVISPLKASAYGAKNKRLLEKRELEQKMQQGVAAEETLTLARRDRELNRKSLATMTQDVVFKMADRFQKPDQESPKAHYDNLKLDLTTELKDKAVQGKVALPAMLLQGDDRTDGQVAEMLLRLAVVDRLVTLAIESGVEKVDAIDGLYGVDSSPGVSPSDPKNPVFLRKYSVFMRFLGREESIFRVLHGAQKKGMYLAVTHFEVTRSNPTKDLFEASIVAALLKVDEKAPMEAK